MKEHRHPHHAIGCESDDASMFGWARQTSGLILFCFIVGEMFLTGFNAQRVVGALLVLSFLATHAVRLGKNLNLLLPVPPELTLYAAWVLWAGVTGPLVAIDMDNFLLKYKVCLQILLLIGVVYGICRLGRGVPNGVYLAFIVAIIVQALMTVGGSDHVSPQATEQERLTTAVGGNANGFGLMTCLGTVCCLMFWHFPFRRRRSLARLAIVLFVLSANVLMLMTASRNAAITMAFIIASWLVFALPAARDSGRRLFMQGVALVACSVLAVVALYSLRHTYMAERFSKAGSVRDTIREDERFELYRDGLKIYSQHPICGVGINNVRNYYWKSMYSHSDYIETLANTGAIGALLYYSFFACILYRAAKLLRMTEEESVRYRVRMVIVGTLSIMVAGVGAVHYSNPPVFIILTVFSAYTWQLLHRQDLGFRDGHAI